MTLQVLKSRVGLIFRRFDVSKAAIFGSYARGEEKKNSDIDILVEFSESKTLFDLLNLQYALEDALKKKVDVLTYNAIHPLLRDRILKEQKIIYE